MNIFEDYKKYLEYLNDFLGKCFEKQKAYIRCEKGCSMCCESGTYPMSELEFYYLMEGVSKLDENLKQKLSDEIDILLREREEFKSKEENKDKNFLHKCPFLVDHVCCLYDYRALICRMYGLLTYHDNPDGTYKYSGPCCIDCGMNFSEVYDVENKKINFYMAKDKNLPEPTAFNVEIDALKCNKNCIHIKFGETKELLEWLK